MTTENEAQRFLTNFHQKLKIFDVVFRGRDKNTQALLDIEITPNIRKEIIESLKPTDYSQGPLPDELHRISEMWVFGKTYKAKEIYIKISMGIENQSTICISFHLSEHKMTYPFKK